VELRRKGRSPNTVYGYEQNYRRNISPTLGRVAVREVTTKQLSNLYGQHQARGLKPATVYQIHACLSSMFTQACRWGWRDSNPAQWADPPSIPNRAPVVPAPADVIALIEEAKASRSPEKARAIFVSATTGMRRAELCALRRRRDIDWDKSRVVVGWSIVQLPGQPIEEKATKNRRERSVALDEFTLSMLRAQVEMLEERAKAMGVELIDDAYVFSDSPDGSEPWKPGSITRYFARLRERVGLEHLDFHYLRKFMETYGEDLGFSPVQVAMRAGHDPSVAAKHYTGSIEESDRALSLAVASLLVSDD
jgi:integrase